MVAKNRLKPSLLRSDEPFTETSPAWSHAIQASGMALPSVSSMLVYGLIPHRKSIPLTKSIWTDSK